MTTQEPTGMVSAVAIRDTNTISDALARADLDAGFVDFADGSEISWCVVYEMASPGPPPQQGWGGADWMVGFPERFNAPAFDREGLGLDLIIDRPLAAIRVDTAASTVSGARDVGRSRARALAGYFHLRTPLLVGARLAWEGPVILLPGGMMRCGTGAARATLRISDEGMGMSRDATASLVVANLPPKDHLALEWLAESRSADALPLKLVDLWFAVVVIVDSDYSNERYGRQPDGEPTQMDRVHDYLTTLPISQGRRDDLEAAFRVAYRLRNRVVHRGDRECVGNAELEAFNTAVLDFLQIELGRA